MHMKTGLLPILLLFIGVPTFGADTLSLNLFTATPEQIAPFLQPQYVKALAQQALEAGLPYIPAENLKVLLSNKELSKEIISNLTDPHQITKDNAELLIKPIIKNLTALRTTVLQKIIALERVLFLKKLTSCKHAFYPFNDLTQKLTQTKNHLIANLATKYDAVGSKGSINYQDDIQLQAMTKQMIDLEYREQQKGRYTFVHGHQWHHHFYQEIYTDLWSIANGPVNNYRFIRYETPNMKDKEAFSTFIKDESNIREKWINDPYIDERRTGKTRLLFMNYGLFSNKRGGENSAAYIKNNRSIISWTINCIDFIKQLELDKYFTPHELNHIETELYSLYTEHKTLNNYGGGLLLSFTAQAMTNSVYPAKPMGYRKTVVVDGFGRTGDTKVVLDALQTAPEKIKNSDNPLFVCVLSYDCALMPNSGVNIYEFNAADQEKLTAWRIKKNKLISWIKERVNGKASI